MRYCQKCSKPLEDGSLFCQNCGAKVETEITVPPVSSDTVISSPPVKQTPPVSSKPNGMPTPVPAVPAQDTKKKGSKKPIVILSIVCGLLVVALVVVFFVFIYPNLFKDSATKELLSGVKIPDSENLGNLSMYEDYSDLSNVTNLPGGSIDGSLSGVVTSYIPDVAVTTRAPVTTTTTTTRTTTTTKATAAPVDLPPVKSHDKNYRVRLDGGVNVREAAYAQAKVIGTISKDSTFSSTAIQGDFVYVSIAGMNGWVHLSGIVEVTDQLIQPASNAYTVFRNGRVRTDDGDGVNLRFGPSTSYGIIDAVLENQIMYIQYEQNGWYYVEYNGVYGWAKAEFVSLIY